MENNLIRQPTVPHQFLLTLGLITPSYPYFPFPHLSFVPDIVQTVPTQTMSVPLCTPAASSSSTLWATASKEWVIPAKPKPGRKPKKDVVLPPSEPGEVDSKGRRVQNRAAQRAFRERKQSQLAELQARVQQYEQGEIERNVALQNIAKRLKEENEKLRRENIQLKEKLSQTEQERDNFKDAAKKRLREESLPRSHAPSMEPPSRKKAKLTMDSLNTLSEVTTVPLSYVSPPSSVSSPESSSHDSFSPMPGLSPNRDPPVYTQGSGIGNIFDFITTSKSDMFEPGGSMDTFDCGFCNENTPCVCRELAQQVSVQSVTLKEEVPEPPTTNIVRLDPPTTFTPTPSSILENLPAYQPPIPLRRRTTTTAVNSIFPITAAPRDLTRRSDASCSGDPSNCLACADDPFGKAFCAAISKSVSSSSACANCPGGCELAGSSGGCCGNPAACGRDRTVSPAAISRPSPGMDNAVSPIPSTSQETIPCDDAWKQIKSHPNATFADLELLAEVVARRSKCTGPRVEISPAPGSITPERGLSPSLLPSSLPSRMDDDSQSIVLTDPHARYHEKQREYGSDPLSGPGTQEVFVRCGRSRVREVQADGVREALRLLDAKYQAP
ncbi:unnamed protein product [Somion occarium]|uniref:BZIP domain-containing protein n=1 Tax=Somion occarium TaxID=3059160 RepID=A0ABP1CL32_9APHY